MQTTTGSMPPRVSVRQNPGDPHRWYFDFDPAAPGGKGGASVRLDPDQGIVSIDGIHKNVNLPARSTGGLLAEGLQIAVFSKPACLEAYNVEPTTAYALASGADGQGTPIGNMLDDAANGLGATVARWEPSNVGNAWQLRIYLLYP